MGDRIGTQVVAPWGDRDEFYHRLCSDELEETLDFVEWAGEYKTLSLLREKYQTLKDVEIC